MNLLFRLFWLLARARGQGTGSALGPCRTSFRVWPSDLDLLFHVNNGVYLSMMDLGRIDLMSRSGLARRVRARGWYPVVVASTIQFRRSLKLFQRFTIETRVLGWDEKAFLLEQRFERAGELVAVAFVRARFLARGGGNVTPTDVLALVDAGLQAPEIPEGAAAWNTLAAESWR